MKEIVIPYKPRPLWKEVIHPALDKYRFALCRYSCAQALWQNRWHG